MIFEIKRVPNLSRQFSKTLNYKKKEREYTLKLYNKHENNIFVHKSNKQLFAF